MLGPLEVRAGSGELLEVGGARLRTLLIMLALRPGWLVRSRDAARDWPVSRPMSCRFSAPVSVSSTDAYCPVSPISR